ncbi:MAG: alpha-L-fucosidase, partial [Pirellulales bacterium]
CTYYSLPDWRDADYPLGSPGGSTKKPHPNMARFYDLIRAQTRELIEQYHPGILWFDGDWEEPWNHDLGSRLYVELKQQNPELIINNRIAKSRPGVVPEGTPRQANSGDYDTPEQRIGSFSREIPWETCMTICQNWSWKPNDEMKSLKECLQALVQTVGGDGNFLFNVGPMPDGRIEPRQAQRLREMGAWLEKYGDGIYGTRGGPFKPGMWGAATCKGNRIHVYVMKWPAQGPFELPPIGKRIIDSRTLSGGAARVTQGDSGISIDVDAADRNEIATVIELTIDGDAFSIEPVDVDYRSGSLARDKRATASNVFYNEPQYAARSAIDDDNATRWATDSGSQPAWLEVDLGEPTKIERFLIDEPAEYKRIEKYGLEAFAGNKWQTIHTGSTIGPEHSVSVATITASRVRLQILKSSDAPTIREFQVYGPSSTQSTTATN